MVLEALQAAYHPYVRDRGLDWEIHIEEVSPSVLDLRQTGARSFTAPRARVNSVASPCVIPWVSVFGTAC